jgi:hypothetical protein
MQFSVQALPQLAVPLAETVSWKSKKRGQNWFLEK